MAKKKTSRRKKTNAKNKDMVQGRILNVKADVPDFRDRMYEPPLIQLEPEIAQLTNLKILDQKSEGACTGFGLAAVINKLNHERGMDVHVSPRMLYEMAKKFDRWPGEDYAGSSCRGAIKGWYNMGVCLEKTWPYKVNSKDVHLTVERAKEARFYTIGAYYRLRKNIVDMHAAMNEVGAIYASADVHDGWMNASKTNGIIKPSKNIQGGHAFAIIGYDAKGFWIQNSWGPKWGRNGLAHWSYEDWQENVKDAWVFRMALPTPQLRLDFTSTREQERTEGLFSRAPRRDEIAGHFVHIDDGQFHDEGRYWSTLEDVKTTATCVAQSEYYDHLMLYAHGGLNSPRASATRIAAMKQTFQDNGVYPFHFMYDTGLLEELKDVVLGKKSNTEEVVGGFTDWSDRLLERTTRRPGRALWREMKHDAEIAFQNKKRPGTQLLEEFLKAMSSDNATAKKIHLVGHSTGAILMAHLLQALKQMKIKVRIASVSLLAPAATVELFDKVYAPLLKAPQNSFGIDVLNIYNLNDEQEQDDQVAYVYRKSLLYLVSNAFEEELEAPLLGMQKFSDSIDKLSNLNFHYSESSRTKSTTHGGFDNDPATMNDVLKSILGKKPKTPFTVENLKY
ncbi:MAG: C1 family peptidase [Planctomycetaceae bacterium]